MSESQCPALIKSCAKQASFSELFIHRRSLHHSHPSREPGADMPVPVWRGQTVSLPNPHGSKSNLVTVVRVVALAALSLLAIYTTTPRPPAAVVEQPVLQTSPKFERARPRTAQPTPDNWKEMSEADKMAFIARNYGPASPPPPTTTPSPPVILPPTTTRVRSRSMASHSTPENWKELRETEKREFITRNYGSLPTYTSGAVPAWDREMSSDRNLR